MNSLASEQNQPKPEFWQDFCRNKGALIGIIFIISFIVLGIGAPLLAPHDPTTIYQDALRLPPAWVEGGTSKFPLGTDDVGRDIVSRLVYGARVSLGIGMAVVLISLTFGTFLGLTAGYFGGRIDWVIMRFTDILMTLPSILLAIVIVSILGPGIKNTIMAVAIVAIPGFTRIVRASAMAETKKQYVQAAKSFGMSDFRIMFFEILPNCMPALIIRATLGLSDGILDAAGLGFLGLGAQPPIPEWGVMLSDAAPYIESSPYMVTMPGICILIVVLGFNLFGDGLRDASDPRLKRS